MLPTEYASPLAPLGRTWRLEYEDVALCLKQIGEESPNHVYENLPNAVGCMYAHGSLPGCLVGHVVARLLPDFPLAALNCGSPGNSPGAKVALPTVGIRCDQRTLDLLERAQMGQDRREPWGQAIAAAFEWEDGRA